MRCPHASLMLHKTAQTISTRKMTSCTRSTSLEQQRQQPAMSTSQLMKAGIPHLDPDAESLLSPRLSTSYPRTGHSRSQSQESDLLETSSSVSSALGLLGLNTSISKGRVAGVNGGESLARVTLRRGSFELPSRPSSAQSIRESSAMFVLYCMKSLTRRG